MLKMDESAENRESWMGALTKWRRWNGEL